MQAEATKPCPQCGATLPASARFCGDCGNSLEPLPVPSVAAAQPGAFDAGQAPQWLGAEPVGSAAVPVSSPPVLPPASPPAPARSRSRRKRRSRRARWLWLPALLVVVLVAGLGAFFFLRGSPGSVDNRHGLRSDIPLPQNSVFAKRLTPGGTNEQFWLYTVDHTASSTVSNFYKAQLPMNGWQDMLITGSNSGDSSEVFACRSDVSIDIAINGNGYSEYGISAPPNGVLLDVSIASGGC
jgi:predicted nucleic acid-binding Zn ribbon protein